MHLFIPTAFQNKLKGESIGGQTKNGTQELLRSSELVQLNFSGQEDPSLVMRLKCQLSCLSVCQKV